MLKKQIFAALLVFSWAMPLSQAPALELGLTPNHVYALWININRALLGFGETVVDTGFHAELVAMKPRKFDNKRPADVFAMTMRVRAAIALLEADIKPNGAAWADEFGAGAELPATDEITPSNVFLVSSGVLNQVVSLLIGRRGNRMTYSQFYARASFTGKTPSKVLGQADLAYRRLQAIANRSGAGPGAAVEGR